MISFKMTQIIFLIIIFNISSYIDARIIHNDLALEQEQYQQDYDKYYQQSIQENSEEQDDLDKPTSTSQETHYYYDYPKYSFKYGVNDFHSGDIKYHKETRDGDKVEGEYHLVEPDGSLRTVEYHVDKLSGFVAVVKKTALTDLNSHDEHTNSDVQTHQQYQETES
ncbi:uncharacterized protein LOC115876325 [Sitophilus oryzae]|uniref:Uncharacterized protein LOC115876325 n=1 Tax=Sitophilus oryzae TaxID=7048 RepID=A0A6J2X9Q4_SITOR|nr:uncharacterized protein LOC115876325 [Sitophilus oryzae]